MKKVYKMMIAVTLLIVVGVGTFCMASNKCKRMEKIETDGYAEKIVLNKLGISASGESVSDVELPENAENSFSEKVSVYKIEAHDYSDKDIKKIAKSLNTSVKKNEKNDELSIQYNLKDGGYLEYFEKAGGIVYISNNEELDGTQGVEFDKNKCEDIAESFIKESNIIDFNDLELQYAKVAESVETENGVQDLSYVLCYIKKSLDNTEYYGVGPGIKIEIAADYSVSGFTSIDKEVTQNIGDYETLDEESVVDKICDGDGVQIDGISEGERLGVSIDDVNICLYSDPITLDQEYFAPYYVLEGTDENDNDITIVLPAVEDDSITYK